MRDMAGTVRSKATHAKCGDCAVRHRALCANCDGEDLERLDRIKSHRSYGPGQTIAWAGERMALVGSVLEGGGDLVAHPARRAAADGGAVVPVRLRRAARARRDAL